MPFGGPGSLTGKFNDAVSNNLNDIFRPKKGPSIGTPGLKFQKGSFIRNDNNQEMVFQFNPSEIDDDLSANYATIKPIQSEQPIYQHLNFNGRKITFDLFINGLEAVNGYSSAVKTPRPNTFAGALVKRAEEGLTGFITKRIPFAEAIGTAGGLINKKFFSNAPPQPSLPTRDVEKDLKYLRGLLHGDGDKAPPSITFNWENYFTSDFILLNMKVKTTMMDRNQNPLHSTVSVTLQEIERNGEI